MMKNMQHHDVDFAQRIRTRSMTRRDFMWLATVGTAGLATGCAVNPVTGRQQFMLMSETQEITLDQQHSPHQFSADYGAVQDIRLNEYISTVGESLASSTHRPHMPYSFRCVNATYVNAYTFPAGSMATTRGIMLEMQDEAELAGLLGHELGHVNARHTAARMSTAVLTSMLLLGGAVVLASQGETWGAVAAGLGGVAAGALLAHYSRSDERQADNLGMEYMTRANYNPDGMVGLMDVLRKMQKNRPSAIEMMFSTHPMSDERYETAVREADTTFRHARNQPVYRERYMDHTAGLRRIQGAIEQMQEGEKLMRQERLPQAENALDDALRQAPEDYAGLVMMAKCQLAMDRPQRAEFFADKARNVYPTEAQAHHISGVAKLSQKRFEEAFEQFDQYERLLPGNPNTIFLKGFSQEAMGHRTQAAQEYRRFLERVRQGEKAEYAHSRLVEWGML
ncbi:M48 family metalloprotease [Desulfonatronum thioautotrophicum]|uniref:M48 family metalloprotease n=1 Tax=Desulfonatronum thioautotrophicum TaxID=617001 RepID=UPI001FC9FCCB|nr:M48 family metalloprotease [Desulfonatronum thioautotrophicum]